MKYLKDLCNNINNEQRNESRLDHIEYLLFLEGSKTNKKVSFLIAAFLAVFCGDFKGLTFDISESVGFIE